MFLYIDSTAWRCWHFSLVLIPADWDDDWRCVMFCKGYLARGVVRFAVGKV